MDCGHPDCTGVHSRSRPAAEWCPRVREVANAGACRRAHTPGTYEYDRDNGIGRAGLAKRRRRRRIANAKDQATLDALIERGINGPTG